MITIPLVLPRGKNHDCFKSFMPKPHDRMRSLFTWIDTFAWIYTHMYIEWYGEHPMLNAGVK